MKSTKVLRKSDGKTVADPCWLADGFFNRFRGLMGRASLASGEGLLLKPCNSIHTFFMRFAIDVVYLDSEGKVLKIRRNFKPWRADLPVFGAKSVLEVSAGSLGEIREGDQLCLS